MTYNDPMQGILTCNPRTVRCLNRKNVVSFHGLAGDALQGVFFTAIPVAIPDDLQAMDADDADMLSSAMRTSADDLTVDEIDEVIEINDLSLMLPGPYALPEIQRTGRIYLDTTSQAKFYDWD